MVGVFPHCDRAVHKGSVPAANCGAMNEWQVHYVELVFNRSGVVRFPGIDDHARVKHAVDIVEEFWLFQTRGRFFPPPDPYETVTLMDGVRDDMKVVGHGGVSAVGGNQDTAAARIVLETVERALDVISDKLPCAQGRPAVGTALPQTECFCAPVAGEHQTLAHTGDAKKLPSLHLPRTQDYVPLVGDHLARMPSATRIPLAHAAVMPRLVPAPSPTR